MPDQDYAGDLSSSQAWDVLKQDPRAVLIDIRTDAEWRFVGAPDLGPIDKETYFVCWQTYPEMQANRAFVADLEALSLERDQPLLLICRSGVRSRLAAVALTRAGFGHCYNVADGFEGQPDGDSHRGTVNGWKVSGLPWRQS